MGAAKPHTPRFPGPRASRDGAGPNVCAGDPQRMTGGISEEHLYRLASAPPSQVAARAQAVTGIGGPRPPVDLAGRVAKYRVARREDEDLRFGVPAHQRQE